jgi:oligopeptide/dipeptide ABC transporter ATP-binding protein
MGKEVYPAISDVSFSVQSGKITGLVGESGCGKSTVARMIAGIYQPTAGEVVFGGRGKPRVQLIFQDSAAALNPRMSVAEIILEPLRIQGQDYKSPAIRRRMAELMEQVGLAERLAGKLPGELSGGQRQRAAIARSLMVQPELLVADEPIASLDISIQAQIISLMQRLQKAYNFTLLFIAHDLSVVRHISHDISVMYLGQLVETSESKELFVKPYHPYTKALLSAIPTTDIHAPMQRIQLKGEITSPINPKPGCRFASRCPYASEECRQPQQLREISPNHFVSCCKVEEINNL